MTNQVPEYELSALIADCGEAGAVYISRGALETAQRDFGLVTNDEVCEFIVNKGLEIPIHINTVPRINDDGPNPALIDAYSFCSGNLFGYFAFFRGKEGRWVIKSFKKNERPDPRSLQANEAPKKIDGGGA